MLMLFSECSLMKKEFGMCYNCPSYNSCLAKQIKENKITIFMKDAPGIINLNIINDDSFEKCDEIYEDNKILSKMESHLYDPYYETHGFFIPSMDEQKAIKRSLDDMFSDKDIMYSIVDEPIEDVLYRIYTDITINISNFYIVKIWALIINYIKRFWLYKYPSFILQISKGGERSE